MINCGIVSLFPEMFKALDYGITGRAIEKGLINLSYYNPRDWAENRHKTVDDRPYGGGPGMLMGVYPLRHAIQAAKRNLQINANSQSKTNLKAEDGVESGKKLPGIKLQSSLTGIKLQSSLKTIYVSPQGKPFKQAIAKNWSEHSNLIFVAGRYEGIDERLIELEIDEEWSLGDYVLSGGELAIMVILDAIIRLIPGALGHEDSAAEDSFSSGSSSSDSSGPHLLDCPHFTRPEEIAGLKVPEVLLSGDHAAILRWRLKQRLGRTFLRRKDLFEKLVLDTEQEKLLQEFLAEYEARGV